MKYKEFWGGEGGGGGGVGGGGGGGGGGRLDIFYFSSLGLKVHQVAAILLFRKNFYFGLRSPFKYLFCIYFINIYYPCNFVVRDVEIAVYLESPRKINFNLVTFLVSEIPKKTGFNYS